jgi:RNA polymerase sigma-70 factor (ECF subfamily)
MFLFGLTVKESERERDTLAERYEQYRYDCLHVALGVLKKQGPAEDAVHEAFLSVILRRGKYLSLAPEDFRKLILVIVKRKCLDRLRRDSKLAAMDENGWALLPDERGRPLEEQVLREMDVGRMEACVARLDERSRQVLRLRYLYEMSYKEIGQALDMTAKNVEVRLARAKETVRELMGREAQA